MKSNITYSLVLMLMIGICAFFIYGFVVDVKIKNHSCKESYDSILKRKYYTEADTKPNYYGGYMAIADIIKKNAKWPSLNCEVTGSIYITFIVEADGKLSNKQIVKGIYNKKPCDYDSAALIAVDYLNDWIPASCEGQAVPMKFFLPININY